MARETLVALAEGNAEADPARLAYGFLPEGEGEVHELSAAGLATEARRVASLLAERMAPGARAVLVYPPGLDFITAFFGCLYAGVIGVPVYPPLPHRLEAGVEAVRRVVADAQAEAILCTGDILLLREALGDAGDVPGVTWLATDDRAEGDADGWLAPRVTPDTIAFLQYTSGSTTTPRGVVLRHRNLLANLVAIKEKLRLSAATVGVSWLPMYHDMGLIGMVLEPLFLAVSSYLMSPLHFLQRPARWLEAVSRFGGTASGGPNFAFDLCVERVSDAELAALDLSTWEVAFSGAEQVRAATVERFVERFGAAGLRPTAVVPSYGLAEATLLLSSSPVGAGPRLVEFDRAALEGGRAVPAPAPDGVALVSSGTPAPETEVAVVDPSTLVSQPDGAVGEIWVAGPGVGGGYWQRPDLTDAVFNAVLADRPDRRFMRTGDLGFVVDGELFLTGRLKDVIIVRGRNLYPHDIEAAVQAADARLRPGCGAAFRIEGQAHEGVAVVQETGEEDADELARMADAARRAVAASLDVQLAAVVLVPPRTVPKTSSGKLKRSECKELLLTGALEPVAEMRHPGFAVVTG